MLGLYSVIKDSQWGTSHQPPRWTLGSYPLMRRSRQTTHARLQCRQARKRKKEHASQARTGMPQLVRRRASHDRLSQETGSYRVVLVEHASIRGVRSLSRASNAVAPRSQGRVVGGGSGHLWYGVPCFSTTTWGPRRVMAGCTT